MSRKKVLNADVSADPTQIAGINMQQPALAERTASRGRGGLKRRINLLDGEAKMTSRVQGEGTSPPPNLP